MKGLNNYALPGNILDRILELERRARWLEDNVAMPVADPGFGEGAITYIEILNQLLEGPDIDLVDSGTDITIGRGGDTILLYDSGGDPVLEYVFTSNGLIAALAAMAAGDKCELPAGTLTGGPWTLAFGTLTGQTRDSSILDGQLTVSDATKIDGLSIIRSEDDAGAIVGIVEGAGDISAKIHDVYIKVENATGEALAVYMASGGRIDATLTELRAPTGSAGYAVDLVSGDFTHWSGKAIGTVSKKPYRKA